MAWHGPAQEDSDVEDDVEGRHQFSAEEPRRAQNWTLSPSVFSFLEETLIIFDWDDTVMPSSWVLSLLLPAPQVMEEGLSLEGEDFTPEQQAKLSELARLATQTLTLAMRLGTVLLVTNAEHGWVELSCRRFLPELLPVLALVRTLSARTQYESELVPTPFEWKLHAFHNEIGRVFQSPGRTRRRNILSFGDSGHERQALINATANMPDTTRKNLKFMDRPGVEELRKQHSVMVKCLRQIVHHDGHLDLYLRCRPPPTTYLNAEMLTMAGSGSDSLELALQRMTEALKLAKQREEDFAASRSARSAAETDLRRDCDDCRQKAAKLWAESQRLQKMLQAAAQNRRIGSLQEFFPRFTGRREIRRARTSMRLADGRSRPCGQNRLLSSFLPKAGEVKE
ncbi:unnamed protein product [Symbiodinium microadriaticum]|nr:unnamed protein product [Symbiodinium microadriaticum]